MSELAFVGSHRARDSRLQETLHPAHDLLLELPNEIGDVIPSSRVSAAGNRLPTLVEYRRRQILVLTRDALLDQRVDFSPACDIFQRTRVGTILLAIHADGR